MVDGDVRCRRGSDPDPLWWMAMYAAAAAVSAAAAWRRLPRVVPASLAAIALAWAATLSPEVVGRVRFARLFASWEMADTGVEAAREMYGLLMIAAWMIVLTVAVRSPVGRR